MHLTFALQVTLSESRFNRNRKWMLSCAETVEDKTSCGKGRKRGRNLRSGFGGSRNPSADCWQVDTDESSAFEMSCLLRRRSEVQKQNPESHSGFDHLY